MAEEEAKRMRSRGRNYSGRGGSSHSTHFNMDSSQIEQETFHSQQRINSRYIDEQSDESWSNVRNNESQLKTSASITSMDSYASSILMLSERRASVLSSVPSIHSPTSEHENRADSEDDSFYNNLPMVEGTASPLGAEGLDYGNGPAIQSSLPETAALARLTCQQVDEMMNLVLAMIRRLDQLDDRVTALVPADQQRLVSKPEEDDNDDDSEDLEPYWWFKGALVIAIPVILAATVKYFRGSSSNRRN